MDKIVMFFQKIWKKLTNKAWFKAAIYRAGWTFLQGIAGGITADQLIWEIKWFSILGIAFSAAAYSFIMSLVRNLPELKDEE